jgi:hypothetical protein
MGGVEELIATVKVGLAPEVFDDVADSGSFWVPEDEAATCRVLDAEQVEFGSQAPEYFSIKCV